MTDDGSPDGPPSGSGGGGPPALPPGAEHRVAAQRRKAEADELARLEAELEEVESYRMPLLDHLVELRDRLIYSAIAVVLAAGVAFFFEQDIFDFLTQPFWDACATTGMAGELVVVHSIFEGFTTYLWVGFLSGFGIAGPVVFYQFWQFVAPGLYRSERAIVLPLTVSSFVLFVLGSAFCYYVIFPYAFPFFFLALGDSAKVTLSVSAYLFGVVWMVLAFGASFQLPVGTWFLARAGLINAAEMWGVTRYAIIAIFVVAMIITPPDPVTQILLAIPLCILWFLSIGVAYYTSTKPSAPLEPPPVTAGS